MKTQNNISFVTKSNQHKLHFNKIVKLESIKNEQFEWNTLVTPHGNTGYHTSKVMRKHTFVVFTWRVLQGLGIETMFYLIVTSTVLLQRKKFDNKFSVLTPRILTLHIFDFILF